jgi:hypothetical protein
MEKYLQCDGCNGWFEYERCNLEFTFAEMENRDFQCTNCKRVSVLEIRVAELERRLTGQENCEKWEKVKKGAKPARPTVESRPITNNKFLELQGEVVEENDDREAVVIGASNVNRINKYIYRDDRRRKCTSFAAFPGASIDGVTEKVNRIVSKKKLTKIFVHVGTNDVARKGSEEIIKDFQLLIREVKSVNPEAEVAVCSMPSRTDRGDVVFSRSEGVNNRLFTVCRNEGAEFIDFRGCLSRCRYPLSRDGVHYSKEGAKSVGEKLGELISSFLG